MDDSMTSQSDVTVRAEVLHSLAELLARSAASGKAQQVLANYRRSRTAAPGRENSAALRAACSLTMSPS